MVSGDSAGGRVLGRRWRDLWRVVRGPVGSKTRGAEGGWGRRREPGRREGAGQRRARVSALRCVVAPTAQLIWGPGADEDVEGQRARVRSGCCTKEGFDVKNGERLTWHAATDVTQGGPRSAVELAPSCGPGAGPGGSAPGEGAASGMSMGKAHGAPAAEPVPTSGSVPRAPQGRLTDGPLISAFPGGRAGPPAQQRPDQALRRAVSPSGANQPAVTGVTTGRFNNSQAWTMFSFSNLTVWGFPFTFHGGLE